MKTARLTPRARRDIIGIRDWIKQDNPTRAVSYVLELTDHMRRLAERPLIGRARPEHGPDIRSMPHGNFVIFYRSAAHGIDVIRVIHGSRNVKPGLR